MSASSTRVEQWIGRGLGAGSFLVVLMIGYMLANLTWLIMSPVQEASLPSSAIVQNNSVRDAVNIASIQRWNLFDVAGQVKEKRKPAEKAAKAPETTLRLVLAGVFSAEIESDSTAIIAEKGREGKLYTIGGRLPGNATLESVLEDRVLLKRNGRMETLTFPKDAASGVSKTKASTGSRARRSATTNNRLTNRNTQVSRRPAVGSASVTGIGKLLNGKRLPKPKELLETLNTDLQKNPAAAIQEMGLNVVPMADGGGYKVSPGAPAALIRMVGLREGDVIRTINGHQLGDVMQDQALYQNLLSSKEVRVEVQRGTRRFTVNVDVPF